MKRSSRLALPILLVGFALLCAPAPHAQPPETATRGAAGSKEAVDARFEQLQHFDASNCTAALRCKVFDLPPSAEGTDAHSMALTIEAVRQWSSADSRNLSLLRLRRGGQYRMERNAEEWSSLTLKGLRNLVFDGNGATILNSPSNTFLAVLGAENVVLRNLRLEPAQRTYLQGTVKTLADQQALVQIDPGYALTLAPALANISRDHIGVGKAKVVAVLFSDAGNGIWEVPEDDAVRPHFEIAGITPVPGKPDQLRVRFDSSGRHHAGRYQYFSKALQSGTGLKLALALPILDQDKRSALGKRRDPGAGDWSALLYLHENRNIRLQNLRITFSPTRVLVAYGTTGRLIIEDVDVSADRPEQLLAVMNGGLILKNNEHGPEISRLHMRGALDDMVNVRTSPALLQSAARSANGPIRYLLRVQRDQGARVAVGDHFAYYDPQSGKTSAGPYRVLRATQRAKNRVEVEFSTPLGDTDLASDASSSEARSALATRFFNLDQAHAGFVIRDSVFENAARNAVICTYDCSVTNSQFRNIGLRVLFGANREVEGGNQPLGPMPGRFVFTGNTIDNVQRTALEVRVLSAVAGQIVGPLDPVWEITGNRFTRIHGQALLVTGFERSAECAACRIERNVPAVKVE